MQKNQYSQGICIFDRIQNGRFSRKPIFNHKNSQTQKKTNNLISGTEPSDVGDNFVLMTD